MSLNSLPIGSIVFPTAGTGGSFLSYKIVDDNLSAMRWPSTLQPGVYRYYFVASSDLSVQDFTPPVRENLKLILTSRETEKFEEGILAARGVERFGITTADFKAEVPAAILNELNSLSCTQVTPIDLHREFTDRYSQTPIYRWVFHPQAREAVLKGDYYGILPVTVELVPTLNCTFRCGRFSSRVGEGCAYKPVKLKYGCWEQNMFDDPRIHMRDPKLMKRLVERLNEAQIKGIIVTGGGEPTLSNVTLDGIKLARSFGINVGLFTNGSVLTPKQIKELLAVDPTFVRISLNAGTEQGHRNQHNYLNPHARYFQKVVENIRIFAQEISQYNYSTEFGIAVLISNRNRGELLEIARRLEEIVQETGGKINYATFRPEVNYFGGPQIPREILAEAENVAPEVGEILGQAGITFRFLSARFEGVKSVSKGYQTCRAHSLIGEIGPDGAMYLCCEKHFDPDYFIGNLGPNSVSEIWNSSPFRRQVADKVNLAVLSECPPVCKPHVYNLIFERIEAKRARGEMDDVYEWVEAQKQFPKTKWVDFF